MENRLVLIWKYDILRLIIVFQTGNLQRKFRLLLERNWSSQRRVRISLGNCVASWHRVKSFVKPVRATIIISLCGLAHNHRLYTHNNTFAAYPRSPNYYRDGNDRNSSDRGVICLRFVDCIMHYIHVMHAAHFSQVKREREEHLELSCRSITRVSSNNGVSPERCCEIMIQGNSAGASDNMRLSTVIEYPHEKVSVRSIVCENCSGPRRWLDD